ncbi:MAG: L,D-transpeptidase/peptidoglycan binding protein [Ruminococcus sp.]|nr:L,D-transpeptidase/peptidoglycan binding protein [Ruminococcus sp.]
MENNKVNNNNTNQNMTKNQKSKEEMARIIAKNMTTNRRQSNSQQSSELHNYTQTDKKTEKKKSKGKIIVGLLIVLLVSFAAAFYLYGMSRTNDKFLPNTKINGKSVGGKTPKEVYDEILKSDDTAIPEKITLVKFDGNEVNVDVKSIGYIDNISESVTKFYDEQNHYLWFMSLFSGDDYSFTPEYSFDNDKLDNQIKRKVIDASADSVPQNAAIEKNGSSFVVVKERKGGKIDSAKEKVLFDYIHECIAEGSSYIDLSEVDCYQKPEITAEQLTETCQKLNDLTNVELTFDFNYTKEVLKGTEFVDWIVLDGLKANESFKVDEDKAMEYVEKLADKYDTYGKDRTFKSTSRGTITVSAGKGCYGWWIDQEKTCDAIVEAVKACKSADVEPIYYINPDSHYEYTCNPDWRTENTDIGNTYMEVDLKKQHFWYYKDGKLKYECDIVSGMPTEERNTPEGVYKLWIKEKDKTLKGSLSSGETWETPVTFWNNISTFGVGLHDATWHSSFGGTRYKQYGSHGCINMPYKAAEYVYKNVPMGTPCVMYW